MDKSVLISEILPKLNRMGVAYTSGQGTDVTIACEFLEAGWGTGNKKINYTALAYFDESENTVYMWELTKEIGTGFSFGGDSETSFQSGTTLFRKVKSVQYGPDGKAYEYTLDLGAIPKVFKEAAKSHGWKFKTVLKCDKASYQPRYVPTIDVKQQPGNAQVPPVNMNLQQDHASIPPLPPPFHQYQKPTVSMNSGSAAPPPPMSDAAGQSNYIPEKENGNPNDTFYAKGSKSSGGAKGVLFWIGLILLALFTTIMFSYSKNSVIGWGLATGLLVLMFLVRRSLTKKGCFIEIIVWVAALIALSLIFAFTMGDSSELSKKPVYEQTLAPSSESQTVSYKDLRITVPGGTLEKNEKLVISTVDNLPEPVKGLLPIAEVYDIKLGELEKFDQPLVIEYPYNEKNFYKEFSLEEQFLPLYYNESAKQWEDVPFTVDGNRKVLQLQMYHLSTIRPYYSYYEGAYVHTTRHFHIMFDPKDPIYRLNSMKYEKYAINKDVLRLNEELPGKLSYYIMDMGNIADEAYEGYMTMGYTLPSSKFKIYLAETCLYSSATGNITIDQRAASENKPEERLKTYIGHELFHGAQNYTIGGWKYNITSGRPMSFWMEATAEYMGDIGLWTNLGKNRTGEMPKVDTDFFTQTFTAFNGTHEYQASQFVKYLQEKYPDISMLDYIKAVRGINDFEVYLNEFLRNSGKTTFMDEYTEFAADMLFNPSSECGIASNKVILEGMIKQQYDVKFEMDEKGTPQKPEVELKIPVKIEKPCTTALYAVKFDAPASVIVPSASDNLINIAAVTVLPVESERGMKQIVKPFADNQEKTISVAKNEILIIIATGYKSAGSNLVLKALCGMNESVGSKTVPEVPSVIYMPTADDLQGLDGVVFHEDPGWRSDWQMVDSTEDSFQYNCRIRFYKNGKNGSDNEFPGVFFTAATGNAMIAETLKNKDELGSLGLINAQKTGSLADKGYPYISKFKDNSSNLTVSEEYSGYAKGYLISVICQYDIDKQSPPDEWFGNTVVKWVDKLPEISY